MRILIEGPELAGKTTITAYLENMLNVKAIKKVKNDADDLNVLTNEFLDSLDNVEDIEIYDRFYMPSDIVYSPIFNNGAVSLLYTRRNEYAKRMNHPNLLVLYVHADLTTTSNRFDKRGDEYLNKRQCLESVTGYQKLMKQIDIQCVDIDTSYLSKGAMCAKALENVLAYKEELDREQN